MIAIDEWPSLVFEFLENHVHVWKDPNAATGVTFEVNESDDIIGDPIRVACKFFFSILIEIHQFIMPILFLKT